MVAAVQPPPAAGVTSYSFNLPASQLRSLPRVRSLRILLQGGYAENMQWTAKNTGINRCRINYSGIANLVFAEHTLSPAKIFYFRSMRDEWSTRATT